MTDLTPLDRIMLRAKGVKALLAGHGLLNARVVGWAGAGKDFGPRVPAEIQVDLPEVTDLTSGDMARLDRELTALVGIEIVTWAARPGEADVLPGEKTATSRDTRPRCRRDAGSGVVCRVGTIDQSKLGW